MDCPVNLPTTRRRGKEYHVQGRWLTPNKPERSHRKGKKRVVLATKGQCGKVIHFGATGYRHNYSQEAQENYCSRSAGIRDGEGALTRNDKWSANYWSREHLWECSKVSGRRTSIRYRQI